MLLVQTVASKTASRGYFVFVLCLSVCLSVCLLPCLYRESYLILWVCSFTKLSGHVVSANEVRPTNHGVGYGQDGLPKAHIGFDDVGFVGHIIVGHFANALKLSE